MRHPDADAVRPVRLAAGMFGRETSGREPFFFPDHAVFADGVLIPVRDLIDDQAFRRARIRSRMRQRLQPIASARS